MCGESFLVKQSCETRIREVQKQNMPAMTRSNHKDASKIFLQQQ